MTALTDTDIRLMLAETNPSRQLIITPLLDPEKQVGPGSIDLRLGTEFLETPRQNSASIDPFAEKDPRARPVADLRTYVPLGDQYVLHPGQFALGATLEFVVLPDDVIGQVLSRSSWGRLGLLVATAVAVQPGFRGSLTLELVNAGMVPIVLRPGLRIAQLQLWRTAQSAGAPYSTNGKYRAPLGPESNRLAWEHEERERLITITNKMHARGAKVPAGDDADA
ncbi:dCTP deaminase [Microbacterium sp. NPDC057650]|uniref:dCTP deaminase n=1 Tax=unclassified Microbacterium TaxID=2609290 RepID=UPI00366D1B6D